MGERENRVTKSLFWRLSEQFGSQIVSFMISIILARILDPNVYGSVAIVTVFITILNALVDGGLVNALVQKKGSDDLDFSSAFYYNLSIGFVLYAILFVSAPLISRFYNDEALVNVIRVLSLLLVVNAFKNIQRAYISKKMDFRKFFFATIGGTIASAVVGIAMAVNGCGVWSIVAQQLVNAVIDTAILWLSIKWRPGRSFSFKRLKELLSYSWKLMASWFIESGYEQLFQLVIGKAYSTTELAYYEKGRHFPELISANIINSIDGVMIPAIAIEQDDNNVVLEMTRKTVIVGTFIVAPMMMGLAAVAESLIILLIKDKWLPAAPFMRAFCLAYILMPCKSANLSTMKAVGRSDQVLKIEIIKEVVAITILMISVRFSSLVMAFGLVALSVATFIIDGVAMGRLLRYGVLKQVKDMVGSILLSFVMGVAVFFVGYLDLPLVLLLLVQVLVGVAVYAALAAMFHLKGFGYCMKIVKSLLAKHRKV